MSTPFLTDLETRHVRDVANDEITALADMLDDLDTGDDAAAQSELLEGVVDKIESGAQDFTPAELRAIRDLLADEALKLAAMLGTADDVDGQATVALDAIQPAIGKIDALFEAGENAVGDKPA